MIRTVHSVYGQRLLPLGCVTEGHGGRVAGELAALFDCGWIKLFRSVTFYDADG